MGLFCPPWIRGSDSVPYHCFFPFLWVFFALLDPDPADQTQRGSGSETTKHCFKFFNCSDEPREEEEEEGEGEGGEGEEEEGEEEEGEGGSEELDMELESDKQLGTSSSSSSGCGDSVKVPYRNPQ
jgi:hypothetical protein